MRAPPLFLRNWVYLKEKYRLIQHALSISKWRDLQPTSYGSVLWQEMYERWSLARLRRKLHLQRLSLFWPKESLVTYTRKKVSYGLLSHGLYGLLAISSSTMKSSSPPCKSFQWALRWLKNFRIFVSLSGGLKGFLNLYSCNSSFIVFWPTCWPFGSGCWSVLLGFCLYV